MGEFSPAAGEKIDTVLETLAFTEDTQIILKRLPEGKIQATSKSWDEAKVVLPDQVLEIRLADGRIRIARKEKKRDTGDLQQRTDTPLVEGEITEYIGA